MIFLVFAFLLYLFAGLFTLIFASYVLYRIGRKFQVGSLPGFLVPIYNIVLLCDCARISRWFAAGILFPAVVLFLAMSLGVFFMGPLVFFFKISSPMVVFATNVYLWGNIAQRLGKNFWVWGLCVPLLFFLPVLALAFDDSTPVEEMRYIG